MSSNIRVNSITPSVGNSVAIGTAGGTVVFQCDTINFSGTSGVTNFTEDISVDGHTELDNVNISGVVTATSFVGPVTGNASSATVATNAQGLTGSPSITVTDITASGNVSIAGTLTYEDVTNIDSIGIITARSGIHVTGGSVGIGTDNPTELLHLKGTSPILRLEDITDPQSENGSIGKIEFYGNDGSSGGADVRSFIQTISTNSVGNAHALIFGLGVSNAAPTEKVRITADGKVGISSTTPKTDVDISQKTGAVALPQGTTAQRPTGSAPYIRKNTTNNALEYFDGTSWVEIITDYFPTGSTILG